MPASEKNPQDREEDREIVTKDAFRKAITLWGTEKIEANENLRPSAMLLNLIASNMPN